ncbi:MAG TPA: hypothetical protein DCG47_07775 [Spirochaetaceae bacterium]|nr:hypothetical protein [Spirochaetaceae bacterium]
MRHPTRPSFVTALIALVTATLMMSAALPPGEEPLSLLPAGPVAVLSIDRPQVIAANIEGFLLKAGFADLAASFSQLTSAIAGQAGGQAPDSLAAIAALARGIDLNRRLVVALYMSQGAEGAEPAIFAYIPARDRQALESALREALQGSGTPEPEFSVGLPGYLTVGIGMPATPASVSGAADMRSLLAYPSTSICIWADKAKIEEIAGSSLGSALSSLLPSSGYGDYEDYEDWDYEEWDDEEWDEESYEDYEEEEYLEEDWEYEEDYDWDQESWDEQDSDWDDEYLDEDWDYEEDYDEEYDWDEWDEEDWDDEAYTNGGFGGLPFSGFEKLMESFAVYLEGIESFDLGITISKERVWLRSSLGAAAGSALADIAAKASAGERSLPYLSYCERDALISGAWSSPMDWAMDILEPLYAAILPQEGAADLVMGIMRQSMEASGANGALSMDLRISDRLAAAINGPQPDEDEVLKLLSEGLSIDLSGVMQLKDRQAFRDALAASVDIVNSSAYQELMAGSGMALSASRSVGANAGIPYDLYTMSFEPGDTFGDGGAAFQALMAKLGSYAYAYAGDKVYYSLGAATGAVDLARRNGPLRSLSSDTAFKTLRAGAPLDTRGLFYLSTKRLVRLIIQLKADQTPLPFAYNELSGFMSWFSVSKDKLGWGMGLGAEDIKAMVALFQ